MKREQLATEAGEVEKQSGGVGREGVAKLVLGAKHHHNERKGAGGSEEGSTLERHVVVHVVVVAQVENHLPGTLLHSTPTRNQTPTTLPFTIHFWMDSGRDTHTDSEETETSFSYQTSHSCFFGGFSDSLSTRILYSLFASRGDSNYVSHELAERTSSSSSRLPLRCN